MIDAFLRDRESAGGHVEDAAGVELLLVPHYGQIAGSRSIGHRNRQINPEGIGDGNGGLKGGDGGIRSHQRGGTLVSKK